MSMIPTIFDPFHPNDHTPRDAFLFPIEDPRIRIRTNEINIKMCDFTFKLKRQNYKEEVAAVNWMRKSIKSIKIVNVDPTTKENCANKIFQKEEKHLLFSLPQSGRANVCHPICDTRNVCCITPILHSWALKRFCAILLSLQHRSFYVYRTLANDTLILNLRRNKESRQVESNFDGTFQRKQPFSKHPLDTLEAYYIPFSLSTQYRYIVVGYNL